MPRFTAKYNLLYAFLVMASTLLLAGCGIKPDELIPPDGNTDAPFPRTYPAPDHAQVP